jgi:CDP-6-deoxy-D-xylo-4-hexulose-3-dehydrase
MISTNNLDLINTVRSLSWWGRDCYCVGAANLLPCGTCGKRFDKWLEGTDTIIDHKYVFTNMGYNLKPLDLQGAIGIEQLKKFSDIDSKRKYHFSVISKFFSENRRARVASQHLQSDPCWFGVPIICDTKETKSNLVLYLEENKIQTRGYFAGNILLHPGYKHLDNAKDFPNANSVLDRVFFIGCPPQYSEEILQYIGEVVTRWTQHSQF